MKSKSPPLLVAIAGGSGAGKTWLAERLQAALGSKAVRVSLDDFYRDRSHLPPARRAQINFDHPRAIDWAAVEQVLRKHVARRKYRLPRYDFATHCRLAPRQVSRWRPVLIVEGLWLLRRRSLRSLFEVRIFVDCPARERWRRRLARDVKSRGRTRVAVYRQFWGTVQPMHARFVAPQRRWANVVLAGAFGPREASQIAAQLRAKLKGADKP